MKNTNFVDIDNSRVAEQKKVMQDILAAGHCPFCPENLKKYHKLNPEIQGEYWLLTPNQWPYENTLFHYLAILKRHATMLSELSEKESSELVLLFGKLEQKLEVKGGAIAMRFGETALSAGTVKHLHAQFIIPDRDKPDFQPIRFKIGSSI